MDIISTICIAIVCILVMPRYSYNAYIVPRETFLMLSGFVLLGVWLMTGPLIRLDPGFLDLIMVMFAWWFFCAAMSPMPSIALRQTLKFAISACFGLFFVSESNTQAALIVLVCAALINAVYVILQTRFNWEPFKNLKTDRMTGLIGNPNLVAAYLVPHIFLTGYLASQSPAWYAALLPLLYALWLTKCRAGLLALMAGIAVLAFSYSPEIFVASVVACACLCLMIKTKWIDRKQSLIERYHYWRIALLQIRKTPLCGLGFDVFKTKVPFLQREINEKTGGEFLKDRNKFNTPYAKHAHNDYLQHCVDNGLPGLGLILAVVGYALMQTGDLSYHAAGLTGILVFGLFFHTFHITVANVIFWYLIGAMVQTPQAWTWDVPVLAWPAYAALGFMVYRFAVLPALNDYFSYRYRESGYSDSTALSHALWSGPYNSNTNMLASGYYFERHVYDDAYQYADTALHHYDGEDQLWVLHTNLGNISMIHGSISLALMYFKEALSFCPWWHPAKEKYDMLSKMQSAHNGKTTPVTAKPLGDAGNL